MYAVLSRSLSYEIFVRGARPHQAPRLKPMVLIYYNIILHAGFFKISNSLTPVVGNAKTTSNKSTPIEVSPGVSIVPYNTRNDDNDNGKREGRHFSVWQGEEKHQIC